VRNMHIAVLPYILKSGTGFLSRAHLTNPSSRSVLQSSVAKRRVIVTYKCSKVDSTYSRNQRIQSYNFSIYKYSSVCKRVAVKYTYIMGLITVTWANYKWPTLLPRFDKHFQFCIVFLFSGGTVHGTLKYWYPLSLEVTVPWTHLATTCAWP
jgi:hypothetical protein